MKDHLASVRRQTSRTFAWLLLAQWIFAVVLAIFVSPYAWVGDVASVHTHVMLALLGGAFVNALPLVLLIRHPTAQLTRSAVAVAQIAWSAILIHLSGGRLETHFHVFVSLAFLALYRDWKILPVATLAIAVDHLLRGLLLPESVYGLRNPEWWRFLEHAGWIVFEDVILIIGCRRSIADMRVIASQVAALEESKASVERQVAQRTEELARANDELAKELRTRLDMEVELRQAQKLESVGRLASGVAHEINTPVQFISDSIHFVCDAVRDLFTVIGKLETVRQSVIDGAPATAAAEEASSAEERADMPYLLENIPKALERSLDGVRRVTTIVRSMKEFAHPDREEMAPLDLNRALDSTLTVARNEYKYVADVETFFGDLPCVVCHAGAINQTFLNIVVNAAHAIDEVVKVTGNRGRIRVRTFREGPYAVVAVEDDGTGIPEDLRARVFDPFFTTKEVGKGTGQGLSIARSIVVDKHGGKLDFTTEPGQGTTFYIRLPIEAVAASGAPARSSRRAEIVPPTFAS